MIQAEFFAIYYHFCDLGTVKPDLYLRVPLANFMMKKTVVLVNFVKITDV